MRTLLRIAGLLAGLSFTLTARAQVVAPPTVDWVSVPSTATVSQSVSVGVGAHANASSDPYFNGSSKVVARIMVDLTRPDNSVTRIYEWLPTWQSPASIWTGFTVNSSGTHYITVQVMDGRPWYSGVYTYAIGVASPAPTITSALSLSVNQGYTTSYQIAATNNPTSFGASNLPAGLSINTSTGVISGRVTPWTSTVNSTITATNAVGTDTKTLTWNITGAVITGSSSVSPTTISSGQSVTLTRAGTANFGIAWTENVIWKPDGSAQVLGNMQLGSQSYTPTAGPGTYHYQVRIVDNSAYNYVDQWIPFTVSAVAAPTGLQSTATQSYSVALAWNSVSGAAIYHLYRNGVYIGSTTGTTFNATSLAAGTAYSFTVQAQDGGSNYSAHSTTLNVTTAGSFEVFTPLP